MEGFVCEGLIYQAADPYPPIQVGNLDRRYAQAMLGNIGGGNSEMSAVARYFYGHLGTEDLPEVAEAFHQIGIVEMRHLEIFGTLARQLGADPRLWCVQAGRQRYWSAGCLDYPKGLGPLIQGAMKEERASIEKYQGQLRWIRDECICNNLRRVIQDEQAHIKVLQSLWRSYVAPR
jgi:bacterioferritin